MFTGIIEATASVRGMEDGQLCIDRPSSFLDVQIGSSIAVNGICLSIIRHDDALFFDVTPETLRKTNLSDLRKGSEVNLERSMQVSSRFDGHIVQGHIEGTATVLAIENEGNGKRLTIELPQTLRRFVVTKGGIALNGVSLTVAEKTDTGCSVVLIPQTLEKTNLRFLQSGMRVNVETDIIGRYLLAAHEKYDTR